MIYLLKVLDLLNWRKKIKKKGKSHPEKTIAEIVKLRRQKADDKDYSDTSSLDVYDDSDEFIDIPDMPPL